MQGQDLANIVMTLLSQGLGIGGPQYTTPQYRSGNYYHGNIAQINQGMMPQIMKMFGAQDMFPGLYQPRVPPNMLYARIADMQSRQAQRDTAANAMGAYNLSFFFN